MRPELPWNDPEIKLARWEQQQADRITGGDVDKYRDLVDKQHKQETERNREAQEIKRKEWEATQVKKKKKEEEEKQAIMHELAQNKALSESEIKRLAYILFNQKSEARELFTFILSKDDEDSANYANIFLDETPTNTAFKQLKEIARIHPKIINRFLLLYARIKRQFPDFKNIQDGFKSIVMLDLEHPDSDYYSGDKEINNKVAERRYGAVQHLENLERIIQKESQAPQQRVLRFQQLYSPRDQGLVELDFFGILGQSIKDRLLIIEERLRKQKKSGKLQESIQHDRLLPTYFRLRSQETINSIIIGETISSFLNLDPGLRTKRCTAGAGIFRKTSYQYALSEDVSIIDLCLNTPNNKVAEVMIVDCRDKFGGKVLLVETAEASDDAFLLPNYKGLPAWTYLLLEEIVDRAYKTKSRIVFSTGLDLKPETNMFMTAATTVLNLVKTVPNAQKYKPRFRDPLDWDEFLATIRWKDNKNAQKLYLEKKYPRTKTIEKERTYSGIRHVSGRAIMAGVDIPTKYTETKTVIEGSIEETGLLPEMYLGAWNSKHNFQPSITSYLLRFFGLHDMINDEKNKSRIAQFLRNHLEKPKKPFYYRGHPNMNNGQGFVNGFEYRIENYQQFKGEMIILKEHLGLLV